MLQPNEIKGDIALELDAESVSAEDFLSCAQAFVSLLREVTGIVNKTIPPNAWYVILQEGSQVLNAVPNLPQLPQPIVDQIARTTIDGFRALDREAEFPREFSARAVENIRTLSRVSLRKDTNRFPVRIIDKRRVTSIGPSVFHNTSTLLDWKYEDFGTVEGTLEAVSVHGRYEVRIYEPIWSRSIKCIVNERLLEIALSFFRRRVEVHGLIRYRNDGTPISVQVEGIAPLPEPSELPSYKKLKGILGEINNGVG